MIDFRYHVVSIVAVFLALALGLFLGSTTLQGRVFDDLKGRTDSVTKQRDQLSAQLNLAQNRIVLDQNFDKALLPYAVSGRLTGQLVTVVSAPHASDAVRKQLMSSLDQAGATVTADVRLQSLLVDPRQEQFLGSLANHLTVATNPADTGADGTARAVGQLAAVLGERPSTHPSAALFDTVMSTYSAAKAVSVAKTPQARAGTLAVVLAGPAPAANADPSQAAAEQAVLLELVRDLDATSAGAVLAAPLPPQGSGPDVVSSAASAGDLTRNVSTVTGVDTPQGQIATIFALAAQAGGVAGRFGIYPNVSPIPTASTSP